MPLSSEPQSFGEIRLREDLERRKTILKRYLSTGEPVRPNYRDEYRKLKRRLFTTWKLEFEEYERDFKSINPKYRIRKPTTTRSEFIRFVRRSPEYQIMRKDFAERMTRWIIEHAEWLEEKQQT